MSTNKSVFYVKNMVCARCIRAVKETFESLGKEVLHIELGKVVVDPGNNIDFKLLNEALGKHGFELLEERNAQLINRIKSFLVEKVHTKSPEKRKHKLSEEIERETGVDYNYASGIFSSLENITIEKYYILQRTERVKELLTYGELTLGEISYQMDYSSIAHLSKQFKTVTGFSPTQFRQLKKHPRQSLDEITELYKSNGK